MSAGAATQVRAETGVTHPGRDGRVFRLRRCADLEELDQCVALEQQSWGYPDREVVPRNLFVLAQALGGHALGAWTDDGQLAGFCLGIAAHEPASSAAQGARQWMRSVGSVSGSSDESGSGKAEAPIPYLHSHMLAIAPEHQNCGLGFALKALQRKDALARGIRVIRWTFDPLMAKNAYFNLHRLGATARMYIPDFYGRLGSALQGGLPTDRLLAEWRLDTERVSCAIDREAQQPRGVVERISLPAHVAAAKARGNRNEAEAMQREIRSRFEAAFTRNLQLVGFAPDGQGGGEYLLTSPASP